MSSINRATASDIIFTDKYKEDRAVKIVTYNNMFDGSLTFAVVFTHDHVLKYEMSDACTDVKIVWFSPLYGKSIGRMPDFDSFGLTQYGQTIFKEEKDTFSRNNAIS